MPRGDKSAYTDKQKRKAAHIEESDEARGVPKEAAEARAYATVNKQDGGGLKSGSPAKDPAARKSPRQKQALREDSARNAVETRRAGQRLAPSSVDEGDATTGRKTTRTAAAKKTATVRTTAKKAPAKRTSSTKAAATRKAPAAKNTPAKKAASKRSNTR